ncbi:MAG: hypothetical protein Q9163_006146 [Psora crenata]
MPSDDPPPPDDDPLDSPPYSPTPSAMERPSLHPQITRDLRQACAALVAMTKPPEPDDDVGWDYQETLKKFEAERKARYVSQMQAGEAKSTKADLSTGHGTEAKSQGEGRPKKEQPRRYSTRRPPPDARDAAAPKDPPRRNGAKDPPGRPKAPDMLRTRSDDTPIPTRPQPVPPLAQTPMEERSSRPPPPRRRQHQHQVESQALGHIRSSMHARPKTSAAACIDYEAGGTTTFSSNSSSASASDYAAVHGRRTSTGVTSVQAVTPNPDGGRASRRGRRPSEGESYSSSMKEEIQELARQRADEYVAKHGQRPPSRTSKLSRMTSHSDLEPARPGSRAGSLASSIAGGISSYMRPRGSGNSLDSTRSGRSSSSVGVSRPHSRSSSRSRGSRFSGAGGWWRNGGLRRRGSWASFRSGGGGGGSDAKERNRLRKNGEPNLNRPLPALPGLDQYKETKTHIGQLVKSSAKRKVKKNKIGVPQPLLPLDTPYTAVLPPQSRSHSNLGYHASSAPLPDDDGTEKEFPRFVLEPKEPGERRSTHPDTSATLTKVRGRPRSSSIHPIHPRRNSLHGNVSASPPKKMPPPIIRGPSYKRELEAGVYPRRMAVNDGTCHVKLYDSQQHRIMTAVQQRDAGDWEKRAKLKGRMGKILRVRQDRRRVVAAM